MKLPKVDLKMLFSLSVVVLVIFSVMIYVNSRKLDSIPQVSTQTAFDREILSIESQSSSDDLDAIENDLNNSDYSNMNKELDSIEKDISLGY